MCKPPEGISTALPSPVLPTAIALNGTLTQDLMTTEGATKADGISKTGPH